MWESGKLDTRLMFYSSCPFILGQQQTNALAPADQKRLVSYVKPPSCSSLS